MKRPKKISDIVSAGLLILGVLAFVLAFSTPRTPGDTAAAARRAQRRIASRMATLESLSAKALAQDPSDWLDLGRVPEDMVIYRYCSDTLESWVNKFPQINDDIKPRPEFSDIITLRGNPQSPLLQVRDSVSYMSFGSKWYLVKAASKGNVKVISALEIVDSQSGGYNGVNPHLWVNEKYSVRPLSDNGGSAVYVDRQPQFKIVYESLAGKASADPLMVGIAIVLLVASGMLFQTSRNTLRRYCIVISGLLLVAVLIYFWGRSAQWELSLFSPTLFAGGAFLYSLGAVIIINFAILLMSVSTYLARTSIVARFSDRKGKTGIFVATLAAVLLILFYSHIALKSIVLNSSISLELYKLSEMSAFTGLVYLSFLTMLLSIPLLLQLLLPFAKEKYGVQADSLSHLSRLCFSIFIALYLVIITSVLGFRKEQSRAEMWAYRLAFDRDIRLEMRLERIEQQIADDAVISALSAFDNTAQTIENRLANEHMFRIDQGYDVSVYVLNSYSNTQRNFEVFNSHVRGGIPLSENSRFLYVNPNGSHSYYAGIFLYSNENVGASTVLITIEPRNINDIKGYSSIFGITPPGKIVLPAEYSYAWYDEGRLQVFKGDYAFPTELDGEMNRRIHEDQVSKLTAGGYTHFIFTLGNDETVIISRQTYSIVNYLVAGVLLAILFFLMLSLLTYPRKQEEDSRERSYYKSRISAVLLTSLTLTLVAMALASVLFVNSRNESNLQTIISDKISSICSMIEAGTKPVNSIRDILTPEFNELLHRVSINTSSDITIYGPSGRVVTSTNPMALERANLGSRIDGDAYKNIVRNSRRYFIKREKSGSVKYYNMYAPLKSASGNVIGILCSPYTDESYDFEKDAVNHSMTIIAVFLLLLLLARFSASTIIDRMFKPLSEVGRKMTDTSLDKLEHIHYDREDEVSSLVDAYNLMVTELSESSKKLAQAERDKAWSGMARQVAHEIKNPLTPMKLQLQRIMRLKAKGDAGWQDKFDEVTTVLLDHIDILTDTANEFSTFAKLYTEEHTEIDLDKVLQEEIAMFDNKGHVKFDYYGFPGTMVMGPKPQLTRVFVNLINNAVQAVGEKEDARVVVALRNSSRDGFFDIVVEDNGPGVSDENVEKLFTPNFTTKNGGSGLGLAISRSILERCGATIFYNRSFTLGGACFTIQYPKQV